MVELTNEQMEAELAQGCLAMIYERILSWGKLLTGPEYNLDSTPPMMYNDALHNLLLIAARMTPEEFQKRINAEK